MFDGIRLIRADLTSELEAKSVIDATGPDVLIHCAGMVSLLGCEKEKAKANAINIQIAKHLTKFSRERDIKFVFISSDFVFDGNEGNYTESSLTSPLNYYGITKVAGEKLASTVPNHIIIRTTFFGTTHVQKAKESYNEWIDRTLKDNGKAFCFTNRFFSPVSTITLSKFIKQLVHEDARGIFNISSDRRISRFDFAQQYARIFGLGLENIIEAQDDVSIRPYDLSLCNDKFKAFSRIPRISIEDELALLKTAPRSVYLSEPLNIANEKGGLSVLFRNELPKGQIYTVTIPPGTTRGNHYHKKKAEWFVTVRGRVQYDLVDVGRDRRETILTDANKKIQKIYVPPSIQHTLVNMGTEDALVIALVNQDHDANHPDDYQR